MDSPNDVQTPIGSSLPIPRAPELFAGLCLMIAAAIIWFIPDRSELNDATSLVEATVPRLGPESLDELCTRLDVPTSLCAQSRMEGGEARIVLRLDGRTGSPQ